MRAGRGSRSKRWGRALSLLASAVLIALPIDARSAPVPPRPHASSVLDAHTIFSRLRNEALGAWLPRGEDLLEPWHRRRAAVGALGWGDQFIVPRDATFFWYGKTALRVLAVYDPVRRVALYEQGCCGWQETVLVDVSKPPPRAVTTANLGAVHSRRGIGLGASPSAVRRAHGSGAPVPVDDEAWFARAVVLSRSAHQMGQPAGGSRTSCSARTAWSRFEAGHGC